MARNFWQELKGVFKEDIALNELLDPSKTSARFYKYLLLLREILRSIRKDKAFNMASALAYKFLTSLVPILFISLSVAAMLDAKGTEEALDANSVYSESFLQVILDQIPPFEGRENLVDWIRDVASKAKMIAGVSFILLFFTAYSLLQSIESVFNMIWKVTEKRPFMGKIGAFLSTLLIVPMLLSLSLFFSEYVTRVTEGADWIMPILSICMTIIALGALYYFLPFTPVKLRNALAGGILAGIFLELAKRGFEYFALYVGGNYKNIYGPLLALPFFLLWIWLVWVIVLIGAEVSFVFQNFRDLAGKAELEKRGLRTRLYFAVRIVQFVSERFHRGEDQSRLIDEASDLLKVPPYIVREVLGALVKGNILRHVVPGEDAYLPMKDINALSVGEVVHAISGDVLAVPNEPDDQLRRNLEALFNRADDALDGVLGRVAFSQLVGKESPPAMPEDVNQPLL
ncbi:MAG: YihY family inner membrane protein [Planctomycetes bacterium]|nr:YihY family inner membrane protein [Planctomycetota bacterium]